MKNRYGDVREVLTPKERGERAEKMIEFMRRAETSDYCSFFVNCIPVPQPRQRHRVVQSGPKAYATNYTPTKHPVNDFKLLVALAARRAWTGKPIKESLEVRLSFRFPLPSSARMADRRRVDAGEHLPYAQKRNDGDNLEKSVWDSLAGICYLNDGQITKWQGERVYANPPGVDVWISEWRP